jgi:uncharacterized protein (UPF0332 family)
MIDIKDIFDDAVTLFSAARSSEARRRTIASRLYYSTFHACLSVARAQGHERNRDSRDGVHAQLIDFFRGSDDYELADMGDTLQTLYIRRIKADYRVNQDVSFSEIDDSRQLSAALIASIKKENGRE